MGLPSRLVEILGCPECHGALDYVEEDNKLKCLKCRLAFRIENDIPVLILEDAEKLQ
jgi:hypothetical protein